MRLIDADSIRFKPYYDEYVDYDGYINDLKTWQLDDVLSDRVDNTPTVEAIPVEWVEKWVDMLKKRNYHSYQVLMPALIDMLEDWNEENGRSK